MKEFQQMLAWWLVREPIRIQRKYGGLSGSKQRMLYWQQKLEDAFLGVWKTNRFLVLNFLSTVERT
jgi:hypothetical protein